MSLVKTYLFDNPAELTLVNCEVDAGKVINSLVDKAGLQFLQGFATDTGFTYDSNLAEFVAGVVRSKSQLPANAVFGGTFPSPSFNLDWFPGGSVTGILNGAPTNPSGKIICAGAQGVGWAYTSLAKETHKFRFTPNYSGAPAPDNVNVLSIHNGTNNNDRFNLTHSPAGGTLRLTLYNSTGSVVIPIATAVGGAWSPTAGQEYEFMVTLDSSAPGRVRVFINGVLHGTNTPGAWTRGGVATRAQLGASTSIYNNGEGSYDDYIAFSDIQETGNYTPGYTIPLTQYSESTVDLPTFDYSGLGFIQLLSAIAITSVGAPRFIVNGDYWDGAAWSISDGSYAEASSAALITANIDSLDVSGSNELDISIVLPTENVQASVDNIDVTYTGQVRSLLGTCVTDDPIITKELISFAAVANEPVDTEIRYIMLVNGDPFWWNGSAWALSNDDATQSNTLAEVQANAVGLVVDNITLQLKVVLISTDESKTPEMLTATFNYLFGALAPTSANQCYVYGFLIDIEGNVIEGATVNVKPSAATKYYKEAASRVIALSKTTTTDDEGFFAFNLIRTSEYEAGGTYDLDIVLPDTNEINSNGLGVISFAVPDLDQVNITDQITAQQ